MPEERCARHSTPSASKWSRDPPSLQPDQQSDEKAHGQRIVAQGEITKDLWVDAVFAEYGRRIFGSAGSSGRIRVPSHCFAVLWLFRAHGAAATRLRTSNM